MIPCYVSGKGMHATETTWEFKTYVIGLLAKHKRGYDTRYRYYESQFPNIPKDKLARMICDPVEYYDKQWPGFRDKHIHQKDEWLLATEFMLGLDLNFQNEARCAIYCYDEAGFGSGVNSMRFLYAEKPIIGFYNPRIGKIKKNLSNFLQLQITHPHLVTLCPYQSIGEIEKPLLQWLKKLPKKKEVRTPSHA